jgi:molybdenum cofactor cytidylyltransferase
MDSIDYQGLTVPSSRVMSAIVLAAGRSERFGRDKRLEPIDGLPMFLRTALALKRLVPDTLVVLGSADAVLRRMAEDRGLDATCCPDAALGMGHSLAHAVAQRTEALGWLIMPADMPFVGAGTLRQVVAAAGSHSRAAPVFRGRRGHPVWFSRQYLDALCSLGGDQGARALLQEPAAGADGSPEPVCLLPVDDPGCVHDVDRPADLAGVAG